MWLLDTFFKKSHACPYPQSSTKWAITRSCQDALFLLCTLWEVSTYVIYKTKWKFNKSLSLSETCKLRPHWGQNNGNSYLQHHIWAGIQHSILVNTQPCPWILTIGYPGSGKCLILTTFKFDMMPGQFPCSDNTTFSSWR